MKDLRKKISLFLYQNSNKGIPNLMLFIAIGNVIVWVFSLVDRSNVIYNILCFQRSAILHGQLWRLFTYIFTYIIDATGLSFLLGMFSLLCYYYIGRSLEQFWGVFRFNCYYFCGVILTDFVSMLFNLPADTTYINMSLFLALATLLPETTFYLWGILPVKAKYLAWLELGFTGYTVLRNLLYVLMAFSLPMFIYALSPLISLLNYILFFGSDLKNLLPDFMRYRTTKTAQNFRQFRYTESAKTSAPRQVNTNTGYRHKCTVCGRTDVSDPNLEFRYCSRCNGFYCYCEDHIGNHVHIQ